MVKADELMLCKEGEGNNEDDSCRDDSMRIYERE